MESAGLRRSRVRQSGPETRGRPPSALMSFKGQRWDFSVDGSFRRHRRRLVNSRGLLWNRCCASCKQRPAESPPPSTLELLDALLHNLLLQRHGHCSDGVDKLLMVFGTLGSIGDGLMTPLTMFVLSRVINEYGAATLTFSNDIIDEYSLKLLIVAIGVGVSAFIDGFCWIRTAERQTSRMRMEYLKLVLRQDFAFFDSQANSSIYDLTSHFYKSTISSDAHLIQDTIAEKVFSTVCYMHMLPVLFLPALRLFLISTLSVCVAFPVITHILTYHTLFDQCSVLTRIVILLFRGAVTIRTTHPIPFDFLGQSQHT
ncbi:hypothetical protein ACLB2K_011877 [Fragaria x ananassa]